MTIEAKQDLESKNREWLAKKRARREALIASRKDPQAPVPTVEAEGGMERRLESDAKGSHTTPVTRCTTLKKRKQAVKEKWPQLRGLADATTEELVRALEHSEQEPQILVELQETWARRARARREAWLKGDSKSAQVVRAKREIKK